MRNYWLLPLLLLASCGKAEHISQSENEEVGSTSFSPKQKRRSRKCLGFFFASFAKR